jgi:hypothetical protein
MQIARVLEEIHVSPSLGLLIICLELPTDPQCFVLKEELRTPCEIIPDIQFSQGLIKLHLLNEPGQIDHQGIAEQLLGSKHLRWVLNPKATLPTQK